MKKIKLLVGSAGLFMLPVFVLAQGLADDATGGPLGELLKTVLTFSNTVLIPFIIGIAFLVFVWGMFQFFVFGGANEEAKEKGKSLIIWATVGFVLIIIFWGVISLLATSTGLSEESFQGVKTGPEIFN